MQSAYFCVIFHHKHKKSPFFVVLTWFLILSKIQDGDHFWWRHRSPAVPPPIKYTSSCIEDQRLSPDVKIVSKYCNISKTVGRVPSINPPPPIPRCGYEFACKSRVNHQQSNYWYLLYWQVCSLAKIVRKPMLSTCEIRHA